MNKQSVFIEMRLFKKTEKPIKNKKTKQKVRYGIFVERPTNPIADQLSNQYNNTKKGATTK